MSQCISRWDDRQKKCKLWIAKTKNKKTPQCTLCQKEIDLSTMGGAALDSHAFSKNHTKKMIDCKQGLDKIFFKKQESISERDRDRQRQRDTVREYLVKVALHVSFQKKHCQQVIK